MKITFCKNTVWRLDILILIINGKIFYNYIKLQDDEIIKTCCNFQKLKCNIIINFIHLGVNT